MTDISATSFFRRAAADDSGGISFEHEEIDTGGTKRPTTIHLHAVEPDSGERMGTLTYHVPRRKADKILIGHLGTDAGHRGKGVGSALMDEMQRRHPATPIDHGDRTNDGKAWWKSYTDGKRVTRGRTMASLAATATVTSGSGSYQRPPGYNPAEWADDNHQLSQDWDRWHPQLQPTIHRALALDLPTSHPAHDARLPLHQRAQALVDHASDGHGIGPHWSDDPAYDHLHNSGTSRIEPGQTAVTLHAHTPAREHIETDAYTHDHHAIRDWGSDEREVPLRNGAPVHITGVSWRSGNQTLKHTFDQPLQRTATVHPGPAAATSARHGDPLRRQALPRTAAVRSGDDIPSGLLNPHGHHVKAEVGGQTNVEMVPRQEIERYASQETDVERAKAVGHHVATSGTMEPLILQYHPKTSEAYLAEGNHRLRAARVMQMDHVPVRVTRNVYGLSGTGVKTPQPHPAIAAGEHIPADIRPSDLGLGASSQDSTGADLQGLHRQATAAELQIEHSEVNNGGTKRPVKATLTAHHPEHGPVGTLDYYPPKRKGGPVEVDGLSHSSTHVPGTGSALLDAMEARHPASRVQYLHATKKNQNTPSHSNGAHGDPTDWDTHYPSLPDTVHRGLTLRVPDHVARRLTSGGPAAEHASDLLSELRGQGGAGIHWSSDEQRSKGFSQRNVLDPRRDVPVVVHASTPDRKAVETRPAQLFKHGVFPYDHRSGEREVPVRKGASMNVTGLSWQPDAPHPEADEHGWVHHSFDRPMRHTATAVPDNTEPYEHQHDWLPPREHFFAPTRDGLDPRLFDGDRIRPEIRQHLLGLLNQFWAPRYGDSWQSWARVYLAGSEASHFYGNDDLDTLIGVDYDSARHHADALAGLTNSEIDTRLTDELRTGLNDDHRMLPGPDGKETGPFESTFYVNPDSWNLKALKPYAAYDLTNDQWEVRPVTTPDDFGPKKLPESTWDVLDAVRALVKAVAELPAGAREREGAALYDYLHADRHSAFGPDGTGLYDPANIVWKALDKAPGKPLQQLIDWKHAHDGVAATDQENAA